MQGQGIVAIKSWSLAVTPNKQVQRTVMDEVPTDMRQRAAAELRR